MRASNSYSKYEYETSFSFNIPLKRIFQKRSALTGSFIV